MYAFSRNCYEIKVVEYALKRLENPTYLAYTQTSVWNYIKKEIGKLLSDIWRIKR